LNGKFRGAPAVLKRCTIGSTTFRALATGANVSNSQDPKIDAPPTEAAEDTDSNVFLDESEERFSSFQVLRKSDAGAAEDVLSELGASDELDRQIILEVSAMRPLGHPTKFPKAHGLAVRSLEVLDRNGTREIKVKAAGPLDPIASHLVSLVTGFIVKSYVSGTIDSIQRLYTRRWANAQEGDPSRELLARARFHTEKLAPGFKRNPLGVPTFLLGGAAVSPAAGAAQGALRGAANNTITRVAATAVMFLALAAMSWVVIRGAAIARRRIKLSTEGPMKALWETIGRCGHPPKDQSKTFAFVAVILLADGWLVIPIGIVVAALGGR